MKRIQLFILLVSLAFGLRLPHATTALATTAGTCTSDWFVVSPPAPPNGTAILERAAGSAPDNVWVVGSATFEGDKTFTARWDGAEWTSISSPNVNGYDNKLLDVTVLSESDAWAVGASKGPNSVQHQLILHWDGNSWTIVSPTTGQDSLGELVSVSGTASDDVWAVGSSGGEGLIRHWNGTAWQDVSSPIDLEFKRVIAKTENEAWALGVDADHNATILRWDGPAWTIATFFKLLYEPGVPGFQTEFVTDFVVPSANAIWVVGGYAYKIAQERRWHWDGSSWTLDQLDQGGAYASTLGIAGPNANDLWDITRVQMTQSTRLSHRTNAGWEDFALTDTVPYPTRASLTSVPGNEFWVVGESEQLPFTAHGIFTCGVPPSEHAVLISPSQDEIISEMNPTFEWQDAANTSFFNLEVKNVVSGSSPDVEYHLKKSPYMWHWTLQNGEFQWRIQACNYAGCGEWSDPVTWTQQTAPPAEAPQLLSPASGTTINSDQVIMSWTEVSATTGYMVEVYTGSLTGPLLKRTSTYWPRYDMKRLNEGTFYWHVQACNPGGCGPSSDMFTFAIARPLPPALVLPEPKSVVNMRRPYFEWAGSVDGLRFRLQLRNKSRTGALVGTVDTETSEHYRWGVILPTGQYYWRVKACNRLDKCSKWSKGHKFFIQE